MNEEKKYVWYIFFNHWIYMTPSFLYAPDLASSPGAVVSTFSINFYFLAWLLKSTYHSPYFIKIHGNFTFPSDVSKPISAPNGWTFTFVHGVSIFVLIQLYVLIGTKIHWGSIYREVVGGLEVGRVNKNLTECKGVLGG